MLWVMYVFNYIDRTNIGNAKTGGMEKDFGLSSSDYSLILSIFFVVSSPPPQWAPALFVRY